MSQYELEFWGKKYTVDWHCVGYGGVRYPAANIKLKQTVNPSLDHQERLNEMIEAGYIDDGDWMDRQQWAEEDVSQEWWSWARELAKEWDLGKVYATGRSGGWLYLEDLNAYTLDQHVEDLEHETCRNCRERYEGNHLGRKCLYSPGRFKPYGDMDSSRRKVLAVIRFLRTCERSMKTWVPPGYKYQLEEQIDTLWAEYTIDKEDHARNQMDQGGGRVPAAERTDDDRGGDVRQPPESDVHGSAQEDGDPQAAPAA